MTDPKLLEEGLIKYSLAFNNEENKYTISQIITAKPRSNTVKTTGNPGREPLATEHVYYGRRNINVSTVRHQRMVKKLIADLSEAH